MAEMSTISNMLLETRQIADCVQAALDAGMPELPPIPRHIYTLARGSSDHAATVIHRLLAAAGIPATTMPPSLLRQPLRLEHSILLAISQSGASPDLSSAAQYCRAQGCPVVAVINVANSQLGASATVSLAQQAGSELAVAATKSVICSVVMGARLAQYWDAPALDLASLPEHIREVQQQAIDDLVELFVADGPLLVIGRGSGLGIASEIALKVQELLGHPAMAYSSAEVLHGPAGMIYPGYPVLALAVGPEKASVLTSVSRLVELGAQVITIEDAPRADALAPTVALARVYLALECACRHLGRSPDKPDNLAKVTLTH